MYAANDEQEVLPASAAVPGGHGCRCTGCHWTNGAGARGEILKNTLNLGYDIFKTVI